MTKLTLSKVKEAARSKNLEVVFNRALDGYQVRKGFDSSEIIPICRAERTRKIIINKKLLQIISSYIDRANYFFN